MLTNKSEPTIKPISSPDTHTRLGIRLSSGSKQVVWPELPVTGTGSSEQVALQLSGSIQIQAKGIEHLNPEPGKTFN